MKLFIGKGASVQATDEIGRKPVHLACYNTIAAAEALNMPDEDFAIRDRDNVGRVPLHSYAVAVGDDVSLVEYVLERTKTAGLDINVVDRDGWRPLLWAARGCDVLWWEDDGRRVQGKDVVEFLLENGADARASGRVQRASGQAEEWSASDIAFHHGNKTLAGTLKASEKQVPAEKRGPPRKVGSEGGPAFCDGCYLVSEGFQPANHSMADMEEII